MDCQKKCQARDDCQFWTWNSETFPVVKNSCWLKSSDSGRKVKKGKSSGPRECQSPITLNAADKVKENAPQQQNEKALISAEEDFINDNAKDVKEQTYECFEVNTSYPGNGITNNKIENVLTAEDCQALCAAQDDCKF